MNLRTIGIILGIVIFLGVVNFLVRQTGVVKQMSEQAAAPTKQSTSEVVINCSRVPLQNVTEGPYYSANSPEKKDLTEEGIEGEKLVLTGYVVDEECRPISNAWLDFWQADGEGNYDNSGYRLRGHQFTDGQGKYSLATVTPGEYPGRTPHIHVKIRATNNSPIITSQLFFPESSTNQGDFVYDKSLEVTYISNQPVRTASYTFVVQK